MKRAASIGRRFAQTAEAQAHRVAARRRNALAEAAWKPSDQPDWLTERVFVEEIQPKLGAFSAARLADTLGISKPYAADIRAGRRRPHQRHWVTLAELTEQCEQSDE